MAATRNFKQWHRRNFLWLRPVISNNGTVGASPTARYRDGKVQAGASPVAGCGQRSFALRFETRCSSSDLPICQ
jgi:hypothetical protein